MIFNLNNHQATARVNINSIGEVVWGASSSGLKGFFGEVKMEINNAGAGKKELFAVSTTFVQSS